LAVVCAALLADFGCSNIERTQIPITTRSHVAYTHFVQGRAFRERHRRTQAYESFEKAVAEDSRFALAYLFLARTDPNPESSFNNLARAVSLADHVSEGERLLIQAHEAGACGATGRRGELLQQLFDLHPGDPRVSWELGVHYMDCRQWDIAVGHFLRAIDLDPTYPPAYNGAGYSYQHINDPENAEAAFLRYIDLIPDDPNPYDSYAELLTELNRSPEAIEYYEKAIGIRSDFVSPYLGIAYNLNRMGRHQEARENLERLLQRAVNLRQSRLALYGMAISHADQGDLQEALERLHESLALAEEARDEAAMAEDLDLIGLVLLEADRPDDASKSFTRALDLYRQSGAFPSAIADAEAKHLQRMALVWIKRGQLETAWDYAKRYLQLVGPRQDPASMRLAHQTLGQVALAKGDLHTAISELAQGETDDAYSLYHLGQAHELSGDHSGAVAFYRRVSAYDQFDRLRRAFVRSAALERVRVLETKASELASS
jgi:tetratricopeptide (TPR) repeat protein